MNNRPYTPTAKYLRINNLDILRGFALLGILIMNIQSFAMPGAAYVNPTVWGDLTGVNLYVWTMSNVIADSKFMGLFSILFGAGVCLFAERAEEKTGKSAELHYKRNFWLLIFGLIHAHLIWYGDILYSYALCAFWVYWFRNRSPRFLIISGMILLSIASFYSLFVYYALNNNYIPEEDIKEILSFWQPSATQLQSEITAYTGDLSTQLHQRSQNALFLETQVFLSTIVWRAGGMMLLGMALYKNGVLTGQKSSKYYLILSIVGLSIGFLVSSYGVVQNFAHDFSLNYSMFLGNQFNYWGSIFTVIGYIGLVNLAINKEFATSLQIRLAKVGQMAFSNYIFHSLFCTLIFYGHGLGLFAELERIQQVMIVLLIWLLQLWYSPIWLKYYLYGPLEWAWRSVTYWQRQPMKRAD
ncbi:MAG: hypothetical protein COA74_01815 [Gammaproteobacteria bacterium]|nr:MAG: hypothetical protein COA74_01815 [Gammaproteobacteria bacterium]